MCLVMFTHRRVLHLMRGQYSLKGVTMRYTVLGSNEWNLHNLLKKNIYDAHLKEMRI